MQCVVCSTYSNSIFYIIYVDCVNDKIIERLHTWLDRTTSGIITIPIQNPFFTYRKVASRSTCYYSKNQVLGGATNRDMSLNETCFYSKIQKIWISKVFFPWMSKVFFAWISESFIAWISNSSLLGFQILLCLDFKSSFAWISNPPLLGFQILLC